MTHQINIKHQTSNIKHFAAFTLIETLVVIFVLGLVFPLVFSIIFVILQQQLKIFRLTEVKRQGDYIVSFLQDVIKDNGYKIYNNAGSEICEAGDTFPFPHSGTPSSFSDEYSSSFSLSYDGSNLSIIYTNPVAPAPTFAFPPGSLNSSKVIVDSFLASCNRVSQFSAPLVSISFKTCYGSCTSTRPEEIAVLDYQTNIKLRSFPTQ
ncbi:type II secretion system protein [Candidatus Roizmanbacteria bacterium]|nr:type II secretion system protein [Candidatus Roizmanbacteria bacterium]